MALTKEERAAIEAEGFGGGASHAEATERFLGDHPEHRESFERRRAVLGLAVVVRNAREAAELSQAQLAKLAGMAKSIIGRIESAKDSRMPSVETIARVFAALGQGTRISFVPLNKEPQPFSFEAPSRLSVKSFLARSGLLEKPAPRTRATVRAPARKSPPKTERHHGR